MRKRSYYQTVLNPLVSNIWWISHRRNGLVADDIFDTPILNSFLPEWRLRLTEPEISQRRSGEPNILEDIPVIGFVVDSGPLFDVTKVDHGKG